MRYLLDTHVFLWWIIDDEQIPGAIREIIAKKDNDLFLSAASCWEIAIKTQLGELDLPEKPDKFILDQLATNAVKTMPILASHALHVFDLPNLHRDPFDRIIIAQAQLERLPIITSDPLLTKYDVEVLWN